MTRQRKVKGSLIRNTLVTWAFAAASIFVVTYNLGYYHTIDLWKNLIAGIHNTLFDILFIGVLIYWLNKRVETRIEIQRYKEEIDIWRNDSSLMARRKNQISIRRLSEYGAYDIDLSGSGLQQVDLTGIILPESNLSEAQCYRTSFKDADLRNAIIDGANLKEAILTRANLSNASLKHTTLEYADLQGANLQGSDLTGANISNVLWKEAVYDDRTKFPHDFDKSEMIYSNVKLTIVQKFKKKW